ncbi:tRNA (adenosine(37)-N6)-dimethylallyltransferase MiaA [Gracilibacillus sp. YIM 98692]|uniref:tRNA (adenosine(37)-N6)-dimethylallyltransferase MiaA n=1 Tax=Gracilibacillus sp. YIM 98692 TaxID=2663532 RepID=UPI0013D5D42D|nr:tRNA (adenosine(37)-N6)-dimethylallyltransferase MiaA [Gracilibacillus sp. YIM 98692]
MKNKVVAVVGPTAVGKTALSIEIAKRFNGEVISGDSMQVFKGLDIGTAKVTETEKQGVPHHMIDLLEPHESFSVAEFQNIVRQIMKDIQLRGKLPVIAGGTGLYIQAILFDYQFADEGSSEVYRSKIEEEIERAGIESVYQRLKSIDPNQAEKVHPNNKRRLIRALEVYERTGKTMTEHQAQQSTALYDSYIVGLEMDRTILYRRINERVDQMINEGLIEEVERLFQQGLANHQSMRGIGYKEVIEYLQGNQSLADSIELLKRNSRRFAKRQYTWFRNKMPVHWYPILPETKDKTFKNILTDLEGFLQ